MHEEQKHSGAGIASFIFGIISLLGIIITFLLARPMADGNAQGIGGYLVVAGFLFFFIVLSLIGCVVSLSGLIQRNRKKLYSVLGLSLNVLVVAFFMIILFAGALLGPALPGTSPQG